MDKLDLLSTESGSWLTRQSREKLAVGLGVYKRMERMKRRVARIRQLWEGHNNRLGNKQQATGDPLERACEFRNLIMTILVKIRYE